MASRRRLHALLPVIEMQSARLRDLATLLRAQADGVSFLRRREAESWRRYADMLDEISHALTEAAVADDVKSVRRIAGFAGAAVMMLTAGLVSGGAQGAGTAAYNAIIGGCDADQSASQFIDENLSLQLELARIDGDAGSAPTNSSATNEMRAARTIVENAIQHAGLEREIAGAAIGVTEMRSSSGGVGNLDDLSGDPLVLSYQTPPHGAWSRLPYELLDEIGKNVVDAVPSVRRVAYVVTDPAHR